MNQPDLHSQPRWKPGVAAGFLALAACLPVGAQTIYRSQDAKGNLTFTDLPAGEPVRARSGPSTDASQLPYELRSAAQRYPVTLYTAADCAPCENARGYLQRRGIPFQERTVSSTADEQALARLVGEVRVPVLAVGQQVVKGYTENQFGAYLDAAGYPKQSQLPRGYAQSAPRPLVQEAAAQTAPVRETPAAAAAAPAPAAPAPASGSASANPAGIRF